MREYLTLGSAPCEESCVQVGTPNYEELSRKECEDYIKLIIKKHGEPPFCAKLGTKSFPHDFGSYREVVVIYDEDVLDATEYAYKVEANSPLGWWDDGTRQEPATREEWESFWPEWKKNIPARYSR